MPRRVLILTNRVPFPLHDGGALAMDAMISGYAASGWAVHLLAMNTSRHYVAPSSLNGLYSDIAGFYTVDVQNEVTRAGILKNLLFSREPEHVARFRSEAFAGKLRQLLGEVAPDVVQLESPFLAAYIPVIRAGSQAIVVYRSHNVEYQIWSRLADESSGLRRIYLQSLARRMSRYEKALWRIADLLIPISAADAAVISSIGVRTPMIVAPVGISTAAGDIPLPAGSLKAYHIGAMDWVPNAEGVRWFLDEVWPKLHEWAPEVEFHFAGRAMPESFKEGLPPNVFCSGEVENAAGFIADKHLLIVPIRSGSGIRVKTLEAMAAGKLVISTLTGIQGIEASDNLHYLRAGSPQEFAHLIAWASSHREKVEAITSAAQELIRVQYDSAVIMHRICGQLEQMIAP